MKDCSLGAIAGELVLEPIQRGRRVVLVTLNFNGHHIVPSRQAGLGKKELNLHAIGCVFAVVDLMEVEFPPPCPEHLGDDVLHQHSFVDLKLARQDLPQGILLRLRIVGEGQREQKPGIGQITLQSLMLGRQRKTNVRIGHIVGEIDDYSK